MHLQQIASRLPQTAHQEDDTLAPATKAAIREAIEGRGMSDQEDAYWSGFRNGQAEQAKELEALQQQREQASSALLELQAQKDLLTKELEALRADLEVETAMVVQLKKDCSHARQWINHLEAQLGEA
jgi:chromosome segregation ATPase